jgi:hypothetical protein
MRDHRKSRNGCKRCKARRVKCDEGEPTCNNCKRHGAVCEYPGQSHKHERPELLPRSPSSSVTTQTSAVFSEPSRPCDGLQSPFGNEDYEEDEFKSPEARRILELRLLHHFTSVVAHTFPSSTTRQIREMWTIDAVRMSFAHGFLLNAMFAISALHLTRNLPESPRFYTDSDGAPIEGSRFLNMPSLSLGGVEPAKVHRFYLNIAVRQQREAVSSISTDNANALILSSVLMSYEGLNLTPEQAGESLAYSPPTQWLHMTYAITQISILAFPLVRDHSVAQFLAKTSLEPDFRDRAAIFNPANSRPFEALLKWAVDSEPDFHSEAKAVYEKALDYTGGVHKALQEREPPRMMFRRILCFGPMVPPKFIAFVEQRRPRALAILAHHCAMAKCVDDHWLFHGLAEREVRGMQTLLPAEWQWAMEWPLAMLERDFSTF